MSSDSGSVIKFIIFYAMLFGAAITSIATLAIFFANIINPLMLILVAFLLLVGSPVVLMALYGIFSTMAVDEKKMAMK